MDIHAGVFSSVFVLQEGLVVLVVSAEEIRGIEAVGALGFALAAIEAAFDLLHLGLALFRQILGRGAAAWAARCTAGLKRRWRRRESSISMPASPLRIRRMSF